MLWPYAHRPAPATAGPTPDVPRRPAGGLPPKTDADLLRLAVDERRARALDAARTQDPPADPWVWAGLFLPDDQQPLKRRSRLEFDPDIVPVSVKDGAGTCVLRPV